MKHQHHHYHHFPELERMFLAGAMLFPPMAISYAVLSLFEQARKELDQEKEAT